MIKSEILHISHGISRKSCHFGFGLMIETVWVENKPPHGYMSENVITYKSHEFEESLQKFAKLVGLYDEI